MNNLTSEYDITIIVPVYNEEGNIRAVERRMRDFLAHSRLKGCVLFVNDGSKDGSGALIGEVCKRNADMYSVTLKENMGLSAALKAGFDLSESRYVGYIDSDLQTDPEDFNLLYEYCEDHELVAGIRTNRKDTAAKRLQSKIANGFRRSLTHDGATDTGCPLKVMHTDYAKRIPMFSGMHRFFAALIQLQGGRVKEVPVRHYPRTAGVSKYNLRNRLWKPLMDCFALRWMKPRYINYKLKETDIFGR